MCQKTHSACTPVCNDRLTLATVYRYTKSTCMYLHCQELACARKCVAKGSTCEKNFLDKENRNDQLKGGYLDPLIIDAKANLSCGIQMLSCETIKIYLSNQKHGISI